MAIFDRASPYLSIVQFIDFFNMAIFDRASPYLSIVQLIQFFNMAIFNGAKFGEKINALV
jgi:hypothetical protein